MKLRDFEGIHPPAPWWEQGNARAQEVEGWQSRSEFASCFFLLQSANWKQVGCDFIERRDSVAFVMQ